MVFRLDKKIKGFKKFRDSEGGSPAAPGVHFEGQIDSLNGSPHLDVNNADMKYLKDAMDLKMTVKFQRKRSSGFQLFQYRQAL